ncbi:MAG: isocitrate lyase family protein [Calditrichaceae bacterium]|nr:isocitrate lyase ICL2 [Calditrichia bacterium]NUQ40933.1 isocitrate lyase family protein [Calditrichaceae bacterium]
MDAFEKEVRDTAEWFAGSRFKEITRLYSVRQVVEQRGTIHSDYTIAKNASREFYELLRELFARGEAITTFGPYSPGQAVTMKRQGIKGIYLGGWATSAKGSTTEDQGADLASYPLSQVPDEAEVIVRALLVADKNQYFARARMSKKERENAPEIDYRPFIIADADTGHGGDAQVRNLIRRFVEAGVSGYHIEDQRPGTKKCGHQGGKVLVSVDEQIKRLNTARFQLDIMKVPGIIVARTDAEAANLLDSNTDERDHPFILGATNLEVPGYKICYLAMMKRFYEKGIREINGHLLYKVTDAEYEAANAWLKESGLLSLIDEKISALKENKELNLEKTFEQLNGKFAETWEAAAGLKTYAEAVAERMKFHLEEGVKFDVSLEEWQRFAGQASYDEARKKARQMGIDAPWSWELARTPEGYYQVRGGIPYAIAKSLAVAPYADILWMETKTADLHDAKEFADAIHAVYPEKMLAYNLSPSFNWDTTGMNDEQMRNFPKELGKMGFVFNFITYGGHQIDGLAAEEFASALQQDGMLALAKIQRRIRLIDSPYRTAQTLVGGDRLDGALAASSGRTATTVAMGKGSTQFQHLVQTEVPPKLLEGWLELWAKHYEIKEALRVQLRPVAAGSELLELRVLDESRNKLANVIFAPIQDRRERHILSVRDQNTLKLEFRQKRLMTLMQLFLIHRYKAVSIHYVTPTEDNQMQTRSMKKLGIFEEVNTEIGDIIVASVNSARVKELLKPDQSDLKKLIAKK